MKDRRGFTLIEVLVAAAVLGIAGTALFGLLSTSVANLKKIEDIHRYELAAQDVMNRVLLLSELPGEGQAGGNLENMSARWTVNIGPWAPENLEDKPDQAVLKVNVFVTWPGRSGERSIGLEALKVARVNYSVHDLQGAVQNVLPR